MAVLGDISLTGCNSIPQFIGGGSIMTFHQTSAPTSWTKVTNSSYDNSTLRVIGGVDGTTLNPGGTTGFTAVFTATKGINFPFSGPSNLSVVGASGYITVVDGTSAADIDLNAGTLGRLRTHNHDYGRCPATLVPSGGVSQPQRAPAGTALIPLTSSATGGGGQHDHGITDSGHIHPISTGQHIHQITDNGHTHTFQMTQRDFNVTYADIILCSKD